MRRQANGSKTRHAARTENDRNGGQKKKKGEKKSGKEPILRKHRKVIINNSRISHFPPHTYLACSCYLVAFSHEDPVIIEAGRMGTSRSLHADAVTPYDCIRFNRYGQAHNFCLARAVSLSPARTNPLQLTRKRRISSVTLHNNFDNFLLKSDFNCLI